MRKIINTKSDSFKYLGVFVAITILIIFFYIMDLNKKTSSNPNKPNMPRETNHTPYIASIAGTGTISLYILLYNIINTYKEEKSKNIMQ